LLQAKAKASKLEHSSRNPAAVIARNPLDTWSWLRIKHLQPRSSSEFMSAAEQFVLTLKGGEADLAATARHLRHFVFFLFTFS
jgi:hypothetical protein